MNDYFVESEDFESVASDIEWYAEAFTPGYFAVKVDYAGGGWQPNRVATMVAHWDTEEFTKRIAGMKGDFWRVGYNTEGDSTLVIHSVHHDGRDVITVSSLPEEESGLWEALEEQEQTYENLVHLAGVSQSIRLSQYYPRPGYAELVGRSRRY